MLKNGIRRVKNNLPYLLELAQGGTAVGTGLNSFEGFDKKISDAIKVELGYDF